MPVKGLRYSQPLALGAIFMYQLVLLYLFEQYLSLGNDVTLFAVPVIYDHASASWLKRVEDHRASGGRFRPGVSG
jgi:hypothetical protein